MVAAVLDTDTRNKLEQLAYVPSWSPYHQAGHMTWSFKSFLRAVIEIGKAMSRVQRESVRWSGEIKDSNRRLEEENV